MSVTIACVTGAKKGEGGGGEENASSLDPFKCLPCRPYVPPDHERLSVRT